MKDFYVFIGNKISDFFIYLLNNIIYFSKYLSNNQDFIYYIFTFWILLIFFILIIYYIKKRKKERYYILLQKYQEEKEIEKIAEGIRRSGIRENIRIENSFNQIGDNNSQGF